MRMLKAGVASAVMAAAVVPGAGALWGATYALSGGSSGYTVVSAPAAYYSYLLDIWPKTYCGMSRPWYYWSETLYVACGSQGLYVSPNGGYSFRKMPVVVGGVEINAAVYDVAFDRDTAGKVTAVYLATDKGLFSTRSGVWARVPLPTDWTGDYGVDRLAAGPPGMIAAIQAYYECISCDGGRNFTTSRIAARNYTSVGPAEINRGGSVFFGTTDCGMWVSGNGGNTWAMEADPYGGYEPDFEWGVTVLASDSAGRVWANSPEGLTAYDPGSGTYQSHWIQGDAGRERDIFITEFWNEPLHAYVACDNGLFVSHDGGWNFSRSAFGGYTRVDKAYVSCQGTVYAAFGNYHLNPQCVLAWSSDGGATFARLANGLPASVAGIYKITGCSPPEL